MVEQVVGKSVDGAGVYGESQFGVGVSGMGSGWERDVSGAVVGAVGVSGFSYYGPGVHGDSGEWSEEATGKGPGGDFRSARGPGVAALSGSGVGGSFTAEKAGQIRLVPTLAEFDGGDAGEPVPRLPTFAKAGELKVVRGEQGPCSLWLCIEGSGYGPGPLGAGLVFATWAEVTLGEPVTGTA
ncbi:hypothetical protein [Streptomyces sp. NPDC059262]|uniref:hypothetical protein n=1 Tax=Streptomyces sp. NPDC059262 TaxID=3346797 RepID=UPI00368B4A57